MYEKLSFTSVMGSVIRAVEAGTGLRCYDSVPANQPYPYYHAEIVGQIPDPSKTMLKERYQLFIHTFSEGNGSVKVFELIDQLREALSEDIILPGDYEITLQTPTGVQQILNEADGSKHAILGWEFIIFYGYKMKI